MKQITFRELQRNTKWMNDLPVELVSRGIVMATIVGAGDNFGDISDSLARLKVAREQFVIQRDLIKEQEKEITELKKQLEKNEIVQQFDKTVLPHTNKTGFGIDPADFLKKKYVPQKCQFYRTCHEPSVGLFTLGQIDNGQWKDIGERHLCQKHADFVEKDRQASWDI